VCCLELLAEVASGRADDARAAGLLRTAAAERAAIHAPPPPLERERHGRIRAVTGDHGGRAGGDAPAIDAVIAEELKATRHATGLPGPGVERPGTGTRANYPGPARGGVPG
jgi:hypothetical protein